MTTQPIGVTFSEELQKQMWGDDAISHPIDFDDAWVWMEYSRKQRGLDDMLAELDEGEDYLFTESGEKATGGRPRDKYYLTVDGFKLFCMAAGTARGKEVRRYFLAMEKEYKALAAEQAIKSVFHDAPQQVNINVSAGSSSASVKRTGLAKAIQSIRCEINQTDATRHLLGEARAAAIIAALNLDIDALLGPFTEMPPGVVASGARQTASKVSVKSGATTPKKQADAWLSPGELADAQAAAKGIMRLVPRRGTSKSIALIRIEEFNALLSPHFVVTQTQAEALTAEFFRRSAEFPVSGQMIQKALGKAGWIHSKRTVNLLEEPVAKHLWYSAEFAAEFSINASPIVRAIKALIPTVATTDSYGEFVDTRVLHHLLGDRITIAGGTMLIKGHGVCTALMDLGYSVRRSSLNAKTRARNQWVPSTDAMALPKGVESRGIPYA